MSERSRGSWSVPTALVVAVVVLVAVAPVAIGSSPTRTAGTGVAGAQSVTTIDSCTTITQPGVYRLADNVSADISGACLHVRSSDVVLDGNGYTVTGDGTGTAVLVYEGEGTDIADQRLSNVTVQDLTVTGWTDGVEVGTGLEYGADGLRLLGVTAIDNRYGVSVTESRDIEVRDVTANGNRIGLWLWETYDGTVTDLTVADNDRTGLDLAQNVGRITFTEVRATGNGADCESCGAIRFSDDAGDNLVRDSSVADNDGAGVAFSDSFDNTIRNSVIEDNGGAGVLGDYLGGERLVDVAVRDNAGHELDLFEGSVELTRVTVGDVRVTLLGGVTDLDTDGDEPFWLDTVSSDGLPPADGGAPVATEALVVDELPGQLRLVYGLDAADYTDEAVDLWRYNGAGWVVEADGTVNGDRFVASVDRDGTFVPRGPAAGPVLEDATLEILSTEENQFDYEIVVEGTAEKTMTEDVAADSGDEVVDNGDGTVTIRGSTGSNSGDAFAITGEILSVEISGVDDGYQLVLDGDDVTDDYAPIDDEGDSDDPGESAVLEVLSTEENQFDYEIVVEGTAEKTMTEDVAADSGDEIVDNGDGTVTIVGSTGSNSGDAFTVSGEVLSVEIDGVDDGYVVLVDGDPVASDLVTDDSDDDDAPELLLEILSTEENQFDYEVVVEGTAEKTMTDDVAADSGDQIVDNDDGTVTIVGSTGSNSGDAFLIAGSIVSVEISDVDDGYQIVLDGDDVTDEYD